MNALHENELVNVSGGSCATQVLIGMATGALKGGVALSEIPGIGTIGGAVIGANVGLVSGALKCLADNS